MSSLLISLLSSLLSSLLLSYLPLNSYNMYWPLPSQNQVSKSIWPDDSVPFYISIPPHCVDSVVTNRSKEVAKTRSLFYYQVV